MATGFVMATAAGTQHLGMIHAIGRHRTPTRWKFIMTGVTHVRSTDMCRRLATGGDAIVTAYAIA